MILNLFAVSIRGRKAYKNLSGTLYLECTSCNAVKRSDRFIRDQQGFQGKHSICKSCKNEVNRKYRMRAKG
jgi:hypothetical protein